MQTAVSFAFSRLLKRQAAEKKLSALLNKAKQTIRPVLIMVKGSNEHFVGKQQVQLFSFVQLILVFMQMEVALSFHLFQQMGGSGRRENNLPLVCQN